MAKQHGHCFPESLAPAILQGSVAASTYSQLEIQASLQELILNMPQTNGVARLIDVVEASPTPLMPHEIARLWHFFQDFRLDFVGLSASILELPRRLKLLENQ